MPDESKIFHQRLRRQRGNAKTHACISCGGIGLRVGLHPGSGTTRNTVDIEGRDEHEGHSSIVQWG